MRVGGRIAERRKAMGLSQGELARRAGLSQPTIGKLEAGISSGSAHMHRIARALDTTAAFLTGDTDDPSEGAPVPVMDPQLQFVTLQVGLPSEAALTAMYEGQLLAFGRLEGVELARALAKRLPKALVRLQAQQLYARSVADENDAEGAEDQATDRPERQQARRT